MVENLENLLTFLNNLDYLDIFIYIFIVYLIYFGWKKGSVLIIYYLIETRKRKTVLKNHKILSSIVYNDTLCDTWVFCL